jgi:bifunctional non-homologous end joining protein LigD
VLVAFDLLYLNGYDLRKLPPVERKAHLKKLVAKTDIQLSESFEVDGSEMFAHTCNIALEGVVSKVRDSTYISGRATTGSRRPAPTGDAHHRGLRPGRH